MTAFGILTGFIFGGFLHSICETETGKDTSTRKKTVFRNQRNPNTADNFSLVYVYLFSTLLKLRLKVTYII